MTSLTKNRRLVLWLGLPVFGHKCHLRYVVDEASVLFTLGSTAGRHGFFAIFSLGAICSASPGFLAVLLGLS